MLELARFSRGNTRYWMGMAFISPWLIAMKLGLVTRARAKEKFLSYFFKGTEIEKFNETCRLFTQKILPEIVKDEAMAVIRKHLDKDRLVVVVTASAENWVAPWCRQNKLQYICTNLEVTANRITGKLLGPNCNGPEKVSRIREKFDTAEFSNIYCYGDSKGDLPMLSLATHPFFRTF